MQLDVLRMNRAIRADPVAEYYAAAADRRVAAGAAGAAGGAPIAAKHSLPVGERASHGRAGPRSAAMASATAAGIAEVPVIAALTCR
jgi:hypothetical protein